MNINVTTTDTVYQNILHIFNIYIVIVDKFYRLKWLHN